MSKMSRFSFDEQSKENAKIKVVGVGGGGGNAINNMINKGLNNVEYIAINTDNQALTQSKADVKIQAGATLTKGLGAGGRPEIGREAMEESRHAVEESIDGSDMIFVTAGMGGGSGTGGAPIVAGIAKRKGILTVGVVTTPFVFEGKVRMNYAHQGIAELKKNCDTLIVIPNDRIMEMTEDDTTVIEAFDLANQVLFNATTGISDLILKPGMVNVDFADVRTTMIDGGAAIMGSAAAAGPDRAEIAARNAINSPLLDGVSIRGARNVLVNICSNNKLGMKETQTAMSIIHQEAGDGAEIIFGTALDDSYGDEIRVTVIATGFELNDSKYGAVVKAPATNASAVNRNTFGGEPAPRTGTAAQGTVSSPATPLINIPRPGDLTGNRTTLGNGNAPKSGEFYKGEKNLKQLDEPSYSRNKSAEPAPIQAPVFQPRPNFGFAQRPSAPVLLNNRTEKIDKSDSEQPAFLRKIMD